MVSDRVIWDRERPPLLRSEDVEGDLDTNLLAALQQDGRETNSALARRFGVSEALVRQRLKRLLQSGVIRYHAVADLRELGLSHMAVVHVATAPGAFNPVAERLRAVPEVAALFVLSGGYSLMFYLIAEDAAAARAVIDRELRARDGVAEIEVNTVISAYKFDGSTGFVLKPSPVED
jgi:Lrp/AsnC family transcriptional regulator for asnA, asnC and gidA